MDKTTIRWGHQRLESPISEFIDLDPVWYNATFNQINNRWKGRCQWLPYTQQSVILKSLREISKSKLVVDRQFIVARSENADYQKSETAVYMKVLIIKVCYQDFW